MISELWALTARQLTKAYSSGEASPVEAVKAVLDRIEAVNPKINAIFWLRPDEVLEEARESEARWRKGSPLSVIDGVPVPMKDSIAMLGTPYWRGCAGGRGTMSTKTAPPAQRLLDAGALIYGKTTMPDSGMLGAGVSSVHGVTRNPWNVACNTGGSSAGSGAALAAGFGPLAIGTDMAGSVRAPSAFNGGVGLKPTQGLVPHLPPSPVRSAGPMARNVADMALLLNIITKSDSRDFGALEPMGRDYTAFSMPLKGKLKFGLVLDAGFGVETAPEVRALVLSLARKLEAEGHELVDAGPLAQKDPTRALDILFALRTRLEVEAFPDTVRATLPPYVARVVELADSLNALDYVKAMDELEQWKAATIALSSPYDFLLTPALPIVSYPADHYEVLEGQPLGHLNMMSAFNQTGQPAIVLPIGFSGGMPVAVQLVGARFDDARLISLAAEIESMVALCGRSQLGLAPIGQ